MLCIEPSFWTLNEVSDASSLSFLAYNVVSDAAPSFLGFHEFFDASSLHSYLWAFKDVSNVWSIIGISDAF